MADTIIAASLSLNAEQANQSVKDFRTQLRESQLEVVRLTEKFGATSKEAVNAAKKTAELRDAIGDARTLVDSFNPDQKFRGVAQALTGVAGGFTAITGAMGLLGVQSEDVQKQLLKVQSALALTQGLNTIGDSVQSFKNLAAVVGNTLVKAFTTLKGAIAATGIGALLVAIGLLIANIDKIKEALFGVDRTAKAAAESAEKGAAAEQKKLDAITEQDNILRLQGKTEAQILKLKIAQTDEVIHQREQQLQAQIELEKSQFEAAKRNHDILKGIIDFLTKPIRFILETAARVSDFLGVSKGALEKVKKISEAVNTELTNFLFDPDEVKKNGDETVDALKQTITKLKNERAGFQLSLNKGAAAEKAAAEKRKELLKQTEEELEKIRSEAFIASFKAGRDRDVAIINQEFETEKKRISALKLANGATAKEIADFEKLKTTLIEENSLKRARRIKEIDDAIAKQREDEEKAALGKLMKVRQENAEAEIRHAQSISFEQIQQQHKASLAEIAALQVSEEEKTKLIGKANEERIQTLLAKFKGEQKLFIEKIQQEYENTLLEIKLSKDTEENKTKAVVKAVEERNKKLADLENEMLAAVKTIPDIKIKIDDSELESFIVDSNKLDEWYKEQLKTVGNNEEAISKLQKEYTEKKTKLIFESNERQLEIIQTALLNEGSVRAKSIAADLKLQLDAIDKEFLNQQTSITNTVATEKEKTELIQNALVDRNKKIVDLNKIVLFQLTGDKQVEFKIKVDDTELKDFTTKNNDLEKWYQEQLQIVGDSEDAIATLQEDYENKKLALVVDRGNQRLKIIAELQAEELASNAAIINQVLKQQTEVINAEFENEKLRIENLKVSRNEKTRLLVEAGLEHATKIAELNEEINKQQLESEKVSAEKLREQKIQEFVNDTILQDEQAKLKIERDYQTSLKEIEQLKASEETKTLLAVEAKVKRDQQLDDLEQVRLEKQAALKLELDSLELDEFALKNQRLDEWYKQRLAIVQGNEELTVQLVAEYEKQKSELVQLENQRRLAIASQLLGQASNLFAKHTAAYKVLAIAQTTIDTYSSAISAYKSLAGIPVVGPALGAVAAGLAIANGLKAIKEIVKTKVPGADSGGGSVNTQLNTATPTAPLEPTPQVGTTTLDQASLNAVGNAANPVQAFVLESDITNNQERITRLNRAARLTG